MPSLDILSVLRMFYSTGMPCLPVGEKIGSKIILRGFLDRKKADRFGSDLNRIKNTDFIPEDLLDTDDRSYEILAFLKNHSSIPVIDITGQKIAEWGRSEFLSSVSEQKTQSTEAEIHPKEENAQAPQIKESPDLWLSKLILSGFPDPLFSADIKGQTLFYNQKFEDNILNQSMFKKSMVNAELYLRELTLDTIARYALLRPDAERYITYDVKLQKVIEICSLFNQKNITGYLYIFKDREIIAEQSRASYVSASLTVSLEDFEREIIFNALKQNGCNISHTAEALQIKRTTLQNRISMLDLQKRIDKLKANTVIRRNKSNQSKTEEKTAPHKKTKSKAADIKNTKSKTALRKKKTGTIKKKPVKSSSRTKKTIRKKK